LLAVLGNPQNRVGWLWVLLHKEAVRKLGGFSFAPRGGGGSGNWRNQTIALKSPAPESMSAMAIYQQLRAGFQLPRLQTSPAAVNSLQCTRPRPYPHQRSC